MQLSIATTSALDAATLSFESDGTSCLTAAGYEHRLECWAAGTGYYIEDNIAKPGLTMEGCATSAHTISTTPGYSHYYACTAAAAGYFIISGTDRPHKCRPIANAKTIACSDYVATQVRTRTKQIFYVPI